MRGIKNSYLFDLKSDIEELPDENQKAVLKILVDTDSIFTENGNGVFFDLKLMTKETISKIKDYIRFCRDAEQIERAREAEESELREETVVS